LVNNQGQPEEKASWWDIAHLKVELVLVECCHISKLREHLEEINVLVGAPSILIPNGLVD
jgi:hypothetical protein